MNDTTPTKTVTMTEDDTITALVIEHRHGSDVSLHPDADAARRHVARYVSEWWADECGDAPMPDDDAEAIEAYFEAANDEFYTITEATYHA